MRELVGRDGALARARTALAGPGVAVIAGASGIGKTAVADRLADEARATGTRVVEVRGTFGMRSVPFGALATYLPVAATGSATETAGRIAEAIAADGPVLVSVDDVHLLDPDSAGLLVGLAADPDVRLLLTLVSTGSPPADIAGLWGRWPDCRIDLEPLGREEIDALVRGVVGEHVGDDVLERVASITLGYPLYVTALAVELGRAGEDGLPVDSGRLTGLFERRVARLGREERHLLDVIAFADSVAPAVVDAIPGSASLAALEREDLVGFRGGRVEVAHPLLASVAVSTMTSGGRRHCAEDLLSAIARVRDVEGALPAVLRAMELGLVPDVPLLVVAAETAMRRLDFATAARITAHAPDAPEIAPLRSEALRHLGEVPEEVPPGLDEGTRTQLVSSRAQALAFVERRFEDAVAILERAIVATVEPANRTRLAMETMVLSGLVGDFDSLLGAARSVGDEADPDTRLLAVATTLFAEGLTLSTEHSDATYRRGLELVDAAVDPLLPDRLEMSRILVAFADGRLREGRAVADSLRSTPALGALQTIVSLLADAWLAPAEARALAESAVEQLSSFDPLGNLPQAQAVGAIRAAQCGAGSGAAVVEEAVAGGDPGVAAVDRMLHSRARAWLAWAEGDPRAGKLAAEAGRETVGAGHRFWGLCGLLDAARLGEGRRVAADLEQLAVTRGSGLAAMASRHARADGPDEWRAVARMWHAAGAPTYAIEAALRAAGAGDPVDRATVQLLERVGAVPVVGSLRDVEPVLTGRQLQVVERVLVGDTNRDAAEHLFLSKRTVDNHVRHVYESLGLVHGREDLLARLGWIVDDGRDGSSL